MTPLGITDKLLRLIGINTKRIKDQEARLTRLEQEFEVLRRETNAITGFEESRLRNAQRRQL